MNKYKRAINICMSAVAISLISIIISLSWKPSPKLINLPFRPKALLQWADMRVHENIRTAVPFLGLGVSVCLLLRLNKVKASMYVIACVACFFFICFVEFVQIFIPSRQADFGDVGWGLVGFLVGLIVTFIIWQIVYYIKSKMPNSKNQ